MANTALDPGGIFGYISTPDLPSGGPALSNDLAARMPIGAKFIWNGAGYRYVKHSTGTGTVTPVVGSPAYAKVLTPGATTTALPVVTVTADQSDSVMGLTCVGVYISVPTNAYYCCVQCTGKGSVYAPADPPAGNKVFGSATDGRFDTSLATTSTYLPQGIVCGTSASSLWPTLLMNMDW